MNYNLACDSHAIIRPSSSSLIQAPSWSCGVGGSAELDQPQLSVGSAQSSSETSHNISNRISLASSNASEQQGRNQQQQSAGNDNQSIGADQQQANAAAAAGVSNSDSELLQPAAPVPRLSLHIPTVYLTRKDPSSSSYHVYQLTIRSSAGDEWSVYRRYSQFHALHHQLKAKEPAIAKLHFPPKRRLNSKASTIVQERRLKLEEYIRCLNTFIEKQPGCSPAETSVTSIGTSSSESSWASVTAALAATAAASASAGRTSNSSTERSSLSESASSSTEPTRLGFGGESGNSTSSRLPPPSVQVEAPLAALASASSSSSSCNHSTATNSAASSSARNSLSTGVHHSANYPTTTTTTTTTTAPTTMTVATTTRIRDSCFIEQASIRSLFHNFISLSEKRSEQFEEANIS